MDDNFSINDFLNDPNTKIKSTFLIKAVRNFNIFVISMLDEKQKNIILPNIQKSKVIIIDQIETKNGVNNKKYLIFGFEKTIIIHKQSSSTESFLQDILSLNPDISVCLLSNIDIKIEKLKNAEVDENFKDDIKSHNPFLMNYITKKKIGISIILCIICYLFKLCHSKQLKKRIRQFILDIEDKTKPEDIKEDEYINIKKVGNGSMFECILIYNMKKDDLQLIKRPLFVHFEHCKLISREQLNYQKMRHPFIPKYFGKVKNTNHIVIEYINGQTMNNIHKMGLTFNDKLTIIFRLMLIFKYLHDNGMIYRDLKPDNVMIREDYTIVLIDFDRLINKEDNNPDQTFNFAERYIAPEVLETKVFSYESDIYSLGILIKFIMNDGKINQNPQSAEINTIIEKCTKKISERFHSISEILEIFCQKYQEVIQLENTLMKFDQHLYYNDKIIQIFNNFHYGQNYPHAQFGLGQIYFNGIYVTRDIKKGADYLSLALCQNTSNVKKQQEIADELLADEYLNSLTANQNGQKSLLQLIAEKDLLAAQVFLGNTYYDGEHVSRDINKAISFYICAAEQNDPEAQYNLGKIYYEYIYIWHDINRVIYYLSLAANQNYPEAQFYLGVIYYKGMYITRDINKAIHYLTLSANQNLSCAQYNLGIIYYNGQYVERNIPRGIQYLLLAAKQNHPEAQFYLGIDYYKGIYFARDINKAIHYFSLAAKQDNPYAQFGLGLIYQAGIDVACDINKAIYYFSLSANQNYPEPQLALGVIYFTNKYGKHDLNKAFHYLSLASNQNYRKAQYCLGCIYYIGIYFTPDINKAIHYFTLAAEKGCPESQFYLFEIYYIGKYVTKDISKAIYYLTLASNQDHPLAQFCLGSMYYTGYDVSRDIKKGIYYIMLASMNGGKLANFAHGFLLHEGKYVKRDIEKAIHYYKEASSFNIQYAKNNLGILYMYGFENIEKRIGNAIEYFEEAIRQTNDCLAMYNLAHFYLYNGKTNEEINKSINLLARLANEFEQSKYLLVLALLKKNGFNIEITKEEVRKLKGIKNNLFYTIDQIISLLKNETYYEIAYEMYKTNAFLYSAELKAISLSDLQKNEKKEPKYKNMKDISPIFYEGFGIDID